MTRFAERLASPKLTLAFFMLMAVGALAVGKLGWPASWAILPSLVLLGLNLVAAILVHPRFRVDLPLLAFHLALLALVLLIAAARLFYFEGRTSLLQGAAFEGELFWQERGPWFDRDLALLHFANDGVAEDLASRATYAPTYNRVRWIDANGVARISEIGDDRPLLLDGYRIYASRNRGFAPVFVWQKAGGGPEYGSVLLRDMGRGGFTPDAGWHLPAGPEIWAMVETTAATPSTPATEPAAAVEPADADAGFGSPAPRINLNAGNLPHRLIVRVGETRYPLRPGESVELPSGRLTYLELKSWMGYRISYDPTVPWLIASVAAAIGSLIWFYARNFLRRPPPAEASVDSADSAARPWTGRSLREDLQ